SRLPGPLLTRAWDLGLIDAPRGSDVVHCVSQATPPSHDAALVVTIHDLAWRVLPDAFPPRGRRWHEASFERALRRADRFVVPSVPTADDLARAGAPASSILVISPGADHLPEPDDDSARKWLQRLGVDGEFLLSVGTLEPRKNLERLAAAYRLCRPALPEPWPLVVVGPTGWGAIPSDVHGLIAGGRVAPAVLASLYKRARMLVYVPLFEGFGLPPIEAMRAGTAVVASPMPSTTEAALVVDPLEPASIAEGILSVSSDDVGRRALIEAGFERTKEMTWETVGRDHVTLWSEL
ncbi:MAG TPA: glycosyltransferase family 1 protein, partial [Acidimicrobiales bacterium]|nr:glycosyltransferase family 1 protein [Acidimicrobiales bacterium]